MEVQRQRHRPLVEQKPGLSGDNAMPTSLARLLRARLQASQASDATRRDVAIVDRDIKLGPGPCCIKWSLIAGTFKSSLMSSTMIISRKQVNQNYTDKK